MNKEEMKKLLDDLEACGEAKTWAKGKSLAEVWEQCERIDWLFWLCGRMTKVEGWVKADIFVEAAKYFAAAAAAAAANATAARTYIAYAAADAATYAAADADAAAAAAAAYAAAAATAAAYDAATAAAATAADAADAAAAAYAAAAAAISVYLKYTKTILKPNCLKTEIL